MAMPSGNLGDLLEADRTETSLFFPEILEPAFSFERPDHLHIKPFLEVCFPARVIRIGFGTNLRVSLNAHRGSSQQSDDFDLPFVIFENAGKHPPLGAGVRPVFGLDPEAAFCGGVSAVPRPSGL